MIDNISNNNKLKIHKGETDEEHASEQNNKKNEEEILKFNSKVSHDNSSLLSFYEFVFGDKSKNIKGIKDKFVEVDKKILGYEDEASRVVNYLKQQKELSDKTYRNQNDTFKEIVNRCEDLTKRIEDLLPGASAAGLSEAYETAMKEHKRSLFVWIDVFVVSLASMMGILCFLLLNGWWSFNASDSLGETVVKVIRLVTVESPVLWLAIVSSRKMNQFIMLIEEYRHKWATMRVYDGMRKAVKEIDRNGSGNDPESQLFIELLKTVQKNPTMSLEKVKSDNILAELKDLLNKTRNSVENKKSETR